LVNAGGYYADTLHIHEHCVYNYKRGVYAVLSDC